MEAVKIPIRQRLLLVKREEARTHLLRHLLWLYSQRWAGVLPLHVVHLPDGRVRTASGFCGHTSFWKREVVNHEHPEAEPPSEDLLAALRGERDLVAVVEDLSRTAQVRGEQP